MSPLPDEHRALLAKEKCIRGPLMPERRARGRLPKIDPLPYDIATACYAIGTRVEVPAGAYLYRQGDTAEPERLRDVSSEHLALGPDV